MKVWGNWYDNNMQQLGPQFCLCVCESFVCVWGWILALAHLKTKKTTTYCRVGLKWSNSGMAMEISTQALRLRGQHSSIENLKTNSVPQTVTSTGGVVDGYQFSMVVWWLWNDRSQLPSTTKPRSQPVWALPFRHPLGGFFGGRNADPSDGPTGDVWNSGLRSFGVQAEHWGLGWFFCRFLVIF